VITYVGWRALGTSVAVFVTEAGAIATARSLLAAELEAIDVACSRFRADSELSRANAWAGRPAPASDLFMDAVSVANRVADATEGVVDPDVGRAIRNLGYDRDFDALPQDGAPPARLQWTAHRERANVDRRSRSVRVPEGSELDLGATAKALAADRAAGQISEACGCGVLVNLGGDVAVAGPPPEGGWRVRVCDNHVTPDAGPGQDVSIQAGGVATSSITVRRWSAGGQPVHHIVDPRTGLNPQARWRTASVAASSCVDANAASTAAIVRGESAPRWLEDLGLPSRLVAVDGGILEVGGWPQDEER